MTNFNFPESGHGVLVLGASGDPTPQNDRSGRVQEVIVNFLNCFSYTQPTTTSRAYPAVVVALTILDV